MKKEKLLVKEINVLSEVISKKVSDERKRVFDEKMKKDKEYMGLLKKIEDYNKEVVKMKKLEDSFIESVKKIEKRLNLGNSYEDSSRMGSISYNGVIGSYNRESRVYCSSNNLSESVIYNRLMIENIDGDLNVNDLIDRLVKEFVGK